MKVRTSDLIGPALDWLAAKCCGEDPWMDTPYSTEWAFGGPIIERESIELQRDEDHIYWWAKHPSARPKKRAWVKANTPLIAAMRVYVASKLGDVVDIPEELMK